MQGEWGASGERSDMNNSPECPSCKAKLNTCMAMFYTPSGYIDVFECSPKGSKIKCRCDTWLALTDDKSLEITTPQDPL